MPPRMFHRMFHRMRAQVGMVPARPAQHPPAPHPPPFRPLPPHPPAPHPYAASSWHANAGTPMANRSSPTNTRNIRGASRRDWWATDRNATGSMTISRATMISAHASVYGSPTRIMRRSASAFRPITRRSPNRSWDMARASPPPGLRVQAGATECSASAISSSRSPDTVRRQAPTTRMSG